MTVTPPQNPQPLPALALIAGLLFTVGAVTAVFVLGHVKHEPFRSTEVSHGSSASAIDPPSDHTDKDGQFLWRLATEGLQLDRSKDMLQGSPGMSLNTASGFADTLDQRVLPGRLHQQFVTAARYWR
jgi:hypothetical protein